MIVMFDHGCLPGMTYSSHRRSSSIVINLGEKRFALSTFEKIFAIVFLKFCFNSVRAPEKYITHIIWLINLVIR